MWTRRLVAAAVIGCLAPVAAVALTRDEENTVDIYRQVAPGVVNITSLAVSYDFFMNPIPSEAGGSGVIIDRRGYILTNHHVVKGSRKLEVTLLDGSRWAARLIGADPLSDLAVLKIDAPPPRLTPLEMGDSTDLKVGQKVLAIGNPFGLEQSLSAGVISSIRKNLKTGDVEMEDVIQTDAAINPGNSGGPMIDSSGHMVGLNTAIFTPSGGNVGIGFAIPINTAKRLVPELIAKGYVGYAWLGAEMQTVSPESARALDLPAQHGAMIARVVRGSPAARAGLLGATKQVVIGNTMVGVGGDIITEADGTAVASAEELIRMLRRRRPGDKIRLTYYRRGAQRSITVELGERPR